MMAEVTMTVDQFTTAHVVGKDAHGNVEAFAVAPTWTVAGSLITITPTSDGTACKIEATVPATPGTSVVTAHYAAPGQPEITAELTVILVAPGITTLEITVDPPANKA